MAGSPDAPSGRHTGCEDRRRWVFGLAAGAAAVAEGFSHTGVRHGAEAMAMMALVGRALTRASARNGLLPAGAVVTALPATPAVETPVPGRPVRRGVDEPGRGRGTQHATQMRRVGGVRDEQLLQLAVVATRC